MEDEKKIVESVIFIYSLFAAFLYFKYYDNVCENSKYKPHMKNKGRCQKSKTYVTDQSVNGGGGTPCFLLFFFLKNIF